MKKPLLLTAIVLFGCLLLIKAQPVQRNMVILEIGTGTWCTYCPGAAKAADQLIDEGKNVAVIENHNGDVYANTYSNARNSYYGISGYPTGYFDGGPNLAGGASCPNGNVYNSYLPLYNQSNAVQSPVSICISGTNTGNNYTVNLLVNKLAGFTSNDLRLHLVLTESHIPVNWQGCMTEVNFVNRLMVPGSNGTAFSFPAGNAVSFTLNFAKDPAWNANNCELVAFVQDNSSKVIFNGIKCALNALPATHFTLNDFSASTTSGCSPLNVAFTSSQPSATSLVWSFTGGSPATATSSNASVVYSSGGDFDVILQGTDGVCIDQKTKPAYIHVVTSMTAPLAPQGNTSMCLNPGNETYSTGVITGATSYVWSLEPAEAGSLTPQGTACLIDWSDTWTGTANLKVKAVGDCGEGPWSPTLVININNYPSQCSLPAGPATLCMNPANSDYNTEPIAGATYYYWELNPTSAGTFYQGSSTITINWADTFTGNATLKVKASSGNCEGTFSSPLAISVAEAPVVFNVSGGGIYCGLNGSGLPVGLLSSESGVTYTLYFQGTPTSATITGTGAAINFGNQTNAGTYSVKGMNGNGCENAMAGTAIIAVDPDVPGQPAKPSGPELVFTSSTPSSTFNTGGAAHASSYTWEIEPADAGLFIGNGSSATIQWNTLFAGTTHVRVKGSNTCGYGAYSQETTVQVEMTVGVGETKNGAIRLYPNPASGFVYLNAASRKEITIRIMDQSGSLVLDVPRLMIDGTCKLDISKLAGGMYMLQIVSGENANTYKLLVR